MKKYRRWLLLILPLAACALGALISSAALLSVPEVRPPHPIARLISTRTAIDVGGLHTVRVYRVPAEMREVLQWYWEEGVWLYGDNSAAPRTFNYGFRDPMPGWPLPGLKPSRYSEVYFADRHGYIEVTTDSRYEWRYVAP